MINSSNNFSITSGTTDTFLGITGTYVDTSLGSPSTRLIIPTPNENKRNKKINTGSIIFWIGKIKKNNLISDLRKKMVK